MNINNDTVNILSSLPKESNVYCINNILTPSGMLEGAILKKYIDNQRISKVKIAADLGMSRQNLFTLFRSKMLSPETKQKFEKYFKAEIFKSINNVEIEQLAQKELSENYDLIEMKATVDQLVFEFSLLKSKIYDIPARQVLEEFERIAAKAVERAEKVYQETLKLKDQNRE